MKPIHREGINFLHQDLRTHAPTYCFDLILCRYVAFTYFSLPLQTQVLGRIVDRLLPRGYLAIGTHEKLPNDDPRLRRLTDTSQLYQKAELSDGWDAQNVGAVKSYCGGRHEQSASGSFIHRALGNSARLDELRWEKDFRARE